MHTRHDTTRTHTHTAAMGHIEKKRKGGTGDPQHHLTGQRQQQQTHAAAAAAAAAASRLGRLSFLPSSMTHIKRRLFFLLREKGQFRSTQAEKKKRDDDREEIALDGWISVVFDRGRVLGCAAQ